MPDGDHVRISAEICAGCGQCAAACPTGAATYALPPPDTLLHKLRAMLQAYQQAGGAQPILLLHDGHHGTPLIDALARHGDGLPANVLPLAVNEVTQVGLEAIVAAFAYGATGFRFLLRAKPLHDVAGLTQTIAMADAILAGLGFSGTPRCAPSRPMIPTSSARRLTASSPPPAWRNPQPSAPSASGATCCALR